MPPSAERVPEVATAGHARPTAGALPPLAADDASAVAAGASAPSRLGRGRVGTFAALRNSGFRWFWLGSVLAMFAIPMDMLARGWLVYDLTGSALSLGTISLAWGLPMLVLAPVGGVLADRYSKRSILLVTQVGQVAVTVITAVLIATDAIQYWHLMLTALSMGTIFAFGMPARQSIIPELVGREWMMNAVALGSGAMNVGRVAGPALAGLVVVNAGVAGVYFVMVAFQVGAFISLLSVPKPARGAERGPGRGPTMGAELVGGLRYLKGHPVLLTLVLAGMVPVLFGMPYMMLMPVFAREVFGVDADGMGLLMSATGVGAILGTLVVASLGDFRRKGVLLLVGGVGFGLALMAFSTTAAFVLGLVTLAFVGLFSTSYMSVNTALVQTLADPQMRGRVMSLMMMTFGLMPLGALPVAALAESLGVQTTVAIGGLLVAGFTVAAFLARRELWRA